MGFTMDRSLLVLVVALLAATGCGPSARELRERTLSVLNTEADGWNGGPEYATTASDAYGRPLSVAVTKTTLDYVLELRTFGPDGLPKNSDDVVVTRRHRHTESSLTKEAAKAAEEVSAGATGGVIKGIKNSLGGGKK